MRVWIRTLFFAFLLAWPLLLFSRPAYIDGDSLAYLKGGEAAVDFVLNKIVPDQQYTAQVILGEGGAALAPSGDDPPKPIGATNGARSAWYSTIAYIMSGSGMRMIPLAIAQVLVTAFTVVLAAEAFGPVSNRAFAVTAVILAVGTPLVLVSNLIMPDIFAGLAALAILIFLFRHDQLSLWPKTFLLVLITLSTSLHASIPPLIVAILLLAFVIWLWRRRSDSGIAGAAMGGVAISLGIGMTMTAASGMLAFGEVSLAPKHFPHALARSISDGPARWYLEEKCQKPRYAVCEVFGTDIPDTITGFLFDHGLEQRATAEQMNRIRAEETEIVMNAARRYPVAELRTLTYNIFRQMALFDNRTTFFHIPLMRGPDGSPMLGKPDVDRLGFFAFFDWITYAVVTLALVWLILRLPKMARRDRDALLLLFGAMVANAIIVVVFSGVAPRYSARVVWVVPLMACLLAATFRRLEGEQRT